MTSFVKNIPDESVNDDPAYTEPPRVDRRRPLIRRSDLKQGFDRLTASPTMPFSHVEPLHAPSQARQALVRR